MRVLVCGGRDFKDEALLRSVLARHHAKTPFIEVIHGAYRGADTLADIWARSNGVQPRPFPADWIKYGYRAGPIRNQKMLDQAKPDLVIAFPGGDGTADMVRRALAAGVEVLEVGV
jgi:hypothetical protein